MTRPHELLTPFPKFVTYYVPNSCLMICREPHHLPFRGRAIMLRNKRMQLKLPGGIHGAAQCSRSTTVTSQ
jgi:hypothetical protein